MWRLVISKEGSLCDFCDWMRLVASDLTRPASGLTNTTYVQPVNTNRTLAA
jgi:hypothetical protein